jgi:predicted nucleotidyltransferase
MDQNEVIRKVKEYSLLVSKHFDLERIILFGSYARGTSNEYSDIDVAVIVKSVTGDYFSVVPLLWKLRRQVDDRIEPVLFEKDRDESGFLAAILKQGIEIK